MKICGNYFFISLLLFFVLNPASINGQTLLSRNDSAEIINGSEELIIQFQYVLNGISNYSVETDVIQNIQISYDTAGGSKQIFQNEDIRIEDDLKKLNYLDSINKAIDKPINQYLFDYSAVFRNAEKNVSVFSSVICDTIYYINTKLFATVYFNSSFNTADSNEWPVTKRKAEIICNKRSDNSWDLKIYQISFNWIDKENFLRSINDQIKNQKYDIGIISDSLKIYFSYYKNNPEINNISDSLIASLNRDLIFADNYYLSSFYDKALEKYRKLLNTLKAYDYIEKRIQNCSVLKLNTEKKKEVDIESALNLYKYAILREDLYRAKAILDTILILQPANQGILSLHTELTHKIIVSKELQNYFNTDEKLFRERINYMLGTADSANEYLYYLRACYFNNRSQYDFALSDLNKTLEMVPLFTAALKLRVQVLLKLHKPANALVDLDLLLKDMPTNDTIFGWIGDSYRLMNNYKDALANYSKAIRLNKKNPEYYYKRGLCKQSYESPGNAQKDFQLAVFYKSRSPDLYYTLYKNYFDTENMDSAFYYLQTAKKLGLSYIYKLEMDTLSENYFTSGLEQLKLNSPQKALKAFRISANLNYEKYESWYNYAKLNLELNSDYKNVISSLDSAIKYFSGDNEYYLLRGKAKYLDQQYESSIADFDIVISDAGSGLINKARAYEGRADAFRSQKNDKRAENEYKLSLENNNKNTSVLDKLAKLYSDNNNTTDALPLYDKLLSISESDSAYFNRGKTLRMSGNCKDANKDFQRVLQKNKDYPFINYEFGMCQKAAENYLEAIRYFTNEILLQPFSILAYSEKANCEFLLDEFTEAYATFRSIISMDTKFINKNPDVCKKYSYCCLYESRNLDEADKYISYGIKMYPDDKYFIFLKAEYYYLSKQIESSKIYFKDAFESKAVTLEQLKKDKIFNKIKTENADIDILTKKYFN
jgi:tetratricopeptide (TPR) repeat protein